jgi:hypothetical protein
MKKGITSEAARRLAVFMQGRSAQQGYDPEEGSLGEAVEDSIWDRAKVMDRLFAGMIDTVKYAVEQAVQDALASAEAEFSAAFDAQIAELSSVVSSDFPEAGPPDPQEFEQLKQQFLKDVRDTFTEDLQLWLSESSTLPSTDSYEVRGLFGGAADRGVTP